MGKEIFKLYGSIFVKDQDAKKKIKGMSGLASKLGGSFTKLGKFALAGGAVMASGIVIGVTALGGIAKKTAEAGDRIDKMSQKIGLSRKSFQEWDFIMSQNGANVESLQSGMKKLVTEIDKTTTASSKNGDKLKELKGNLNKANEELSKQRSNTKLSKEELEKYEKQVDKAQESLNKYTKSAKLNITPLEELGINLEDNSGKLRNQEEIMFDAVRALQNMEDGTRKSQLANELFGRAGSEMMPLLNGEAESVEDLRKKFKELGMEMSDESIDSSVKFSDQVDQLKRSFSGLALGIGGDVLPFFTKLLDNILPNIPKIRKYISDLLAPIKNLIPGAIDSFKDLISFFTDGFNGVGDPKALDGIWLAFYNIGKKAKEVYKILKKVFVPVIETAKEVFEDLSNVLSGKMSVWDTLKDKYNVSEQTLNKVKDTIIDFVDVAKDRFNTVKELVQKVFTSIYETVKPLIDKFITEMLPVIKEFVFAAAELFVAIQDKITLVLGYISDHWGRIWGILGPIVEGVLTVVFTIIKSVFEIIKNIFKLFTSVLKGDWKGAWEAIKNIVKTLLQSIFKIIDTVFKTIVKVAINWINSMKENLSVLFSKLKSKIKNIMDSIKNNIKTAFENIKNFMQNPIKNSVAFIKKQIEKIKGFFTKLKIKFPKIKLPHFKIKGSFDIGPPPKVPKLSVSWYKKGGIFNSPSIIGVGEAGTEAVLPIDKLGEIMSNIKSSKEEAKKGDIVFAAGAFSGSFILDDYGTDKIIDRISRRLKEKGIYPK